MSQELGTGLAPGAAPLPEDQLGASGLGRGLLLIPSHIILP